MPNLLVVLEKAFSLEKLSRDTELEDVYLCVLWCLITFANSLEPGQAQHNVNQHATKSVQNYPAFEEVTSIFNGNLHIEKRNMFIVSAMTNALAFITTYTCSI